MRLNHWKILIPFGVSCLLWNIPTVVAQQSSKLNIELYKRLLATPATTQDSTVLPVLLQGDLKALRPLVEQVGGTYRYEAQNIAAVSLSLRGIEALLDEPALHRLEYREARLHRLDDHPEDSIMLQHNNVRPTHQGQAPLPNALRGEGVLLGMIDDGIEWRHPDFWEADSTTRLHAIWDQNSTSMAYAQTYYGYGAEWPRAAIDAYQCTHRSGDHGSHVLGIAAGNARATGKYLGIAPNAELAVVAIQENNRFLPAFVDGLHYLFALADTLGLPCVVNSSVGSYSSGHDGKDLYAQLVAQLIQARPGRALVQAGGNARQFNFHIGAHLQQDTALVNFQYNTALGATAFTFYADTADFGQIEFGFALLEAGTQRTLAQTQRFLVGRDFTFMGSIGHHHEILFYDAQGQAVTLDIYVDQYADAYEVEVVLRSATNLGNWQLQTIGTGQYDLWSSATLLGTSNIIPRQGLHQLAPDNEQTIVGYWTCTEPVVVVGAYQNRQYIVNYTRDTVNVGTVGYPVPSIAAFSSLGPTRTGLIKPDLNAPGGQVMSATTLSILQANRNVAFSNRLDADGWHWLNRGTSMSAPMVAGAIALYFECQPQANYTDVFRALRRSARLDGTVLAQTQTLPNIHWGYGKLDVSALTEACLIRGCMDSIAINFNPNANLPDSTVCQYLVAAPVQPSSGAGQLTCFPNPAMQQVQVVYTLANASTGQLTLYNLLGQPVVQQALTQKDGSPIIDLNGLPSGCYVWVLEARGQRATHLKLMVTNP